MATIQLGDVFVTSLSQKEISNESDHIIVDKVFLDTLIHNLSSAPLDKIIRAFRDKLFREICTMDEYLDIIEAELIFHKTLRENHELNKPVELSYPFSSRRYSP